MHEKEEKERQRRRLRQQLLGLRHESNLPLIRLVAASSTRGQRGHMFGEEENSTFEHVFEGEHSARV